MKHNRLRKAVALLLALVLCLSALAACDANKPVETQPKETKPAETKPGKDPVETTAPQEAGLTFPLEESLHFTAFNIKFSDEFLLSNSQAIQLACERANITVDFTEVLGSEAKEKGNLMMTGGEYPDFLIKSGLDLDYYGMEELLIPLEDLIRQYAPNLTKLLDEKNGWNEIAAPDGHIYGLPVINQTVTNGGGNTWINQRWLDNLGLKMPSNEQEFYDVLKAFKEKDMSSMWVPVIVIV